MLKVRFVGDSIEIIEFINFLKQNKVNVTYISRPLPAEKSGDSKRVYVDINDKCETARGV